MKSVHCKKSAKLFWLQSNSDFRNRCKIIIYYLLLRAAVVTHESELELVSARSTLCRCC
jgi:hypothetical protein